MPRLRNYAKTFGPTLGGRRVGYPSPPVSTRPIACPFIWRVGGGSVGGGWRNPRENVIHVITAKCDIRREIRTTRQYRTESPARKSILQS